MKDSRSVRVLVTASLALPIALLVLTPLVISPGVFAHFSLSKAVYARSLIELLAVAWAVQMLRSPELRPRHSWVVLALLAYLLASALAAVGGVNVSRSVWSTFDRMTGVFDLLHWSVLALVLSSVVRSQRSWHFLLNGQLVVTLLVALIAATQVWGISFIPSVIAKCRVDGTMGNASYLAPVLVMSILIAAGLLAQSFIKPGGNKWGYRRVLWISVVVLGSLVLVYTGTRGALIGLAAGAIAMPLALYFWGNRRALKPIGLASAGLMLTVGAAFALDSTIGLPVAGNCANSTATARLTELAATGTNDSSLALRLSSTRAGFQGFLERPFLGWGPENFGYAFNQHVDPQIFQQGSFLMDKAHNQVVEEFTTKGLVGGLAFLGMWVVLARVVIRQKRPVHEEILSYAILAALGGYFVQNLFLFDTPSSMLYWAVMVAWVSWRERADREHDRRSGPIPSAFRHSILVQAFQRCAVRALAIPRSRVPVAPALTAVMLIALAVSLYSYNLQPYRAARNFGQTSQPGISHQERLVRAQESFETFPPMANQTRRVMLLETLRNWQFLAEADRDRSTAFFGRELGMALAGDPRDAPMLIAAILFIQSTVNSAEVLTQVNPMLSQLYEIAPDRAETHQLLAAQAVLEGQYSAALGIAAEYQARAPGTEIFFTRIEQVARENLALSAD